MALKTKPSQITAEDHRLVRQFIKDSKAAGFDPTLTTIVLNKTRSDKSGKTAKKVAAMQRRKPKGKPKADPARAARSAEARRQAAQAGREGQAIREEGGYLTGGEWAKMAGEMMLTVAGGAGVNLLLKGAGAAVKGGQALLKGTKAAKLLKGAPKLLKGQKGLGGPKPKSLPPGGPKQLPAGGGPKGGGPLRTSTGRPLGSPKQLADKTAWVAKQERIRNKFLNAPERVAARVKAAKRALTKSKAKPKAGKPEILPPQVLGGRFRTKQHAYDFLKSKGVQLPKDMSAARVREMVQIYQKHGLKDMLGSMSTLPFRTGAAKLAKGLKHPGIK